MMSPMFTEVKLRGMGQAFPGMNPSGGPAYMYQAATPAAAPLQPSPTPSVAPQPAPTLPSSPAGAAASDGSAASPKIPTRYYLGAVAIVAFAFSLILPSSK
jgi:hypothetical protein